MVAGRDAGDATRQRVGVEVEHHRQCAARLEAPGALEQLFLQPDMRRLTDRRGESIVDEQPDGCRDDEVAEPRSVGTDRIDRRRVDRVLIVTIRLLEAVDSGLGFEDHDRDLPSRSWPRTRRIRGTAPSESTTERSRVSPSATCATTLIVLSPTSIEARGLATRLWYQSGLVGAPAFEANTT